MSIAIYVQRYIDEFIHAGNVETLRTFSVCYLLDVLRSWRSRRRANDRLGHRQVLRRDRCPRLDAPHSGIYPLRRMEEAGLVEPTVVPRGEKAKKPIYEITEESTAELRGG